jgi:hypothetical protein
MYDGIQHDRQMAFVLPWAIAHGQESIFRRPGDICAGKTVVMSDKVWNLGTRLSTTSTDGSMKGATMATSVSAARVLTPSSRSVSAAADAISSIAEPGSRTRPCAAPRCSCVGDNPGLLSNGPDQRRANAVTSAATAARDTAKAGLKH